MSGANPGLGYDVAPPLSAPLRFFLTAPLFGVAAGLVLVGAGDVLASRWTPGALAVVHLFAVGFLLQVMLGALIQILPVVAGAPMPAPLWLARLVHAGLGLGTVGLAAGLGYGQPHILIAGGGLLGATLGGFLACAVYAIARAPTNAMASRTPRDLRLALIGLAVAGALGLVLALGLGRGVYLPLPFPLQVDLHAGWALFGWAGLLLAATSWVVVPMFHITPAYPTALTRFWAPLMLGLLAAWTIGAALDLGAVTIALLIALQAGAALFAGITLRQQSRTRRSNPDASFRAFRLSMRALLAGIAVLLVALASQADHWPVLTGVLVLHGGLGGATSAMLYKIVPFLAWLNLTQAGIKAPNVKKLMPETRVRAQLRMHAATLAALSIAALVPVLAPLAGLMLAVESAWLLLNLFHVIKLWRAAQLPGAKATPAPGRPAAAD